MISETLTNCPFCGKMTITVLHIPLTVSKVSSRCRAGGTTKIVQKERFDILSGCDACGKSKKEVEKELNEGKQVPHEEKLKRSKKAGMPTMIETPTPDMDEWDDD